MMQSTLKEWNSVISGCLRIAPFTRNQYFNNPNSIDMKPVNVCVLIQLCAWTEPGVHVYHQACRGGEEKHQSDVTLEGLALLASTLLSRAHTTQIEQEPHLSLLMVSLRYKARRPSPIVYYRGKSKHWISTQWHRRVCLRGPISSFSAAFTTRSAEAVVFEWTSSSASFCVQELKALGSWGWCVKPSTNKI